AALPAVLDAQVLLVDDEADIRHTVSRLLDEAGYVVKSAANSSEALAAVHAGFVPDVLVADYAMPGDNGVELALKLRQLQPDLPVLFLSGHVDHAVVTTAAPGARLLRKPFRVDELLGAVGGVVGA
ncbi:MAG: response regulator, partial [Aquincola sp.]|nr:response regulator [Aquincola sp.]